MPEGCSKESRAMEYGTHNTGPMDQTDPEKIRQRGIPPYHCQAYTTRKLNIVRLLVFITPGAIRLAGK